MVKNLPCNAGDAILISYWGTKIPHATEQLSPSTTVFENMDCCITTKQEILIPSCPVGTEGTWESHCQSQAAAISLLMETDDEL